MFDKGFDPTLFESIDKVLVATLGKNVVLALYYQTGIPKNELHQRPLEVIQHLKTMLGEVGFRVIERPIISEIRARFEISDNVHDMQEAIETAKRNYLQGSL